MVIERLGKRRRLRQRRQLKERGFLRRWRLVANAKGTGRDELMIRCMRGLGLTRGIVGRGRRRGIWGLFGNGRLSCYTSEGQTGTKKTQKTMKGRVMSIWGQKRVTFFVLKTKDTQRRVGEGERKHRKLTRSLFVHTLLSPHLPRTTTRNDAVLPRQLQLLTKVPF